MKHLLLVWSVFVCFLTGLPSRCQSQETRTQLPTGWWLTPAGTSIPLSADLPLNIALAPDGVHAAVTNNGNGTQTIDLIDIPKQRVVSSVTIGKSWLGLAFSKKHPWLFVSGGNDDWIIRYTLTGDTLLAHDTLILGKPWPAEKISPTGLTIDDKHDRLYVVTKEDDALYTFDLLTGKKISRTPLSAEAYTCLLSPEGNELYISAWGGRKIYIYDTRQQKLRDSVATEDHPNDLVLDRKGRYLFVANANSNSVSVIATATDTVLGAPIAVGGSPDAVGVFIGPAPPLPPPPAPTLGTWGLFLSALLLGGVGYFVIRNRVA